MKLLVVAGEASADLHAGHLVERLRAKAVGRPLEIIGIGGDRLVAEGLCPVKHAREMAVVGFTEALRKIPQTLRLLNELEMLAAKEKPDAALLLDLPDFNLRLAPRLKKLGIPVIYYISPQVWAWRSGRVHQMAECIDLLLSILPFEQGWYKEHAPAALRVHYVGHPVLEEIPDLPYEPLLHRIAILPGSRESEWRNLFGPMIGAAALLARSERSATSATPNCGPDGATENRRAEAATGDYPLEFHLPLAEPLRGSELVREFLSPTGPYGKELAELGERFQCVEEPAHEVLRRSRAAWIASGTATLEAAIVGTPMVVAYKVSATTAFIFKHLVRYQGAVAMVNLIHAGLGSTERPVTEVLQADVNSEILAARMRELLCEPKWSKLKEKLAGTRKILSGAGLPLENAASAVLSFMEARGI